MPATMKRRSGRMAANVSTTTTVWSASMDDTASPPAVVTPIKAKRTRIHDNQEDSPSAKQRGRPRKLTSPESNDAEQATNDNNNNNSDKPSFTPPPDWLEIYQLVQELRQDRTAPCDHSGAEALANLGATAKQGRFYALVALLLSSQTKDAVVAAAMKRMHQDGILDASAIVALPRSTLAEDYLYSVGFRNNKAKYLQETCQILLQKYDGDIPPTAALLMELPGVGPKMAFICENIAWHVTSGIGVDTHMHRLFRLLQWVPSTKTPEQTRLALESWLPTEYWPDVNVLWVGLGQEVQQEQEKILRKALHCSKPDQALRLLTRCGLDVPKAAKKFGLDQQVSTILATSKAAKDNAEDEADY